MADSKHNTLYSSGRLLAFDFPSYCFQPSNQAMVCRLVDRSFDEQNKQEETCNIHFAVELQRVDDWI